MWYQYQLVPIKELKYDDDVLEGAITPTFAGFQCSNKFSLPAGWVSAKILKARYYINYFPAQFEALIYGSDGASVLGSLTVTPTSTGWFDVDLTGLNILVSGDFYVAMEWLIKDYPYLGEDITPPIDSMSYTRRPGEGWRLFDRDFGIRVVVE